MLESENPDTLGLAKIKEDSGQLKKTPTLYLKSCHFADLNVSPDSDNSLSGKQPTILNQFFQTSQPSHSLHPVFSAATTNTSPL